MMHTYRRCPSVAAAALAVLASALLSLAACGGGSDEESLPSVADVAPELADLGDLATLHSQPVSETFGPDGGTLDLADGAHVELPEGAFPEPTELTVAIVDVEVEDPVEELRVYHLSTVEDVGPLGAPVVLEVPQLADQVVVAELVDGEWQALVVSTGTTTRVSIDHFSSTYAATIHCQILVFLAAGDMVSDNIIDLAALVCGGADALTAEDQAFVNNLVNIIADDLRRAEVSNEDIAAAKTAVRGCLTNRLLSGDTHETALDTCDPTAKPEPTEPGTGTEPEPAEPGTGTEPGPAETGTGTEPGPAEPEPDPAPGPGQTSKPTSTPTPTPTATAAAPTQKPSSIRIVGHTLERRDDHVCKPTQEFCTYMVTVSVEYTTSVPSAIFCFQVIGNGSAGWGNDRNVPSGSRTLTLTNDLHSSPPDGPYPIPITCDLRDASSGTIFASSSVPVNVSPPPPPD